jgi:hypothetical protein
MDKNSIIASPVPSQCNAGNREIVSDAGGIRTYCHDSRSTQATVTGGKSYTRIETVTLLRFLTDKFS